jgi:hypothetical protein
MWLVSLTGLAFGSDRRVKHTNVIVLDECPVPEVIECSLCARVFVFCPMLSLCIDH